MNLPSFGRHAKRTASGRRSAILATLLIAAFVAAPVDVADATHIDPVAGARSLQVIPDLSSRNIGTTQTVTARLSSQATFAVDIDFEFESGPGDPGDGNTPEVPDRTCRVPIAGTECGFAYTSAVSGIDIMRVWIDHDGIDGAAGGITEADPTEGPYSGPSDCTAEDELEFEICTDRVAQPGLVPEPDLTDVIQTTWETNAAAFRLDCNPEQQASPVDGADSAANFTCTVVRADGSLRPGTRIDAENLNGANDPDDSATTSTPGNPTADYPQFCTTQANGSCTGAIRPTEGQTGSANICFWADTEGTPTDDAFTHTGAENDGGLCDEEAVNATENNNLTDVTTQTWQRRAASGLDVQPDDAVNEPGSSHTVTATVYDQFGALFLGNTIARFEFFAGSVSDPDSGSTASTPDMTCTTSGSSSCGVTYSQPNSGTDLICGWITSNTPGMTGGTTDGTCGGEPRVDPSNNDGVPSPSDDFVDVVRKRWVGVHHVHLWMAGTESANCESGTAAARHYVPASQTLVVCVHDSGHQGISTGAIFGEGGPASPDSGSVGTDVNGRGSFSVNSRAPGSSQITASSGGKTSNAVGITWEGGYWFVASDGGIFSFGDAAFYGSTGAIKLNQPIVGMAGTPSGNGYWFVASDGGIFAFGDAQFFGSTGAIKLNQPIVGMAATPSGNGYWLVARDGGIFAFGDAGFYGSTGAIVLNQPIVGMAATPSGNGYWFVASDGGIFAFGDAGFYGSMGGNKLNQPIVGMAATPSGNGYWFVARDGGIFSFGGAGFYGSTGDIKLNQPIVGMESSYRGQGYWFVAADGGIFSFGDTVFLGSMGDTKLNQPIVGMARAL